ncbi:hypothetical protein BTUL_0079g00160 [Botrytis tulipae]|uniref:Uncharacterized protein n=1 Tax=Botrytis tulipae TaxID=87230 RepID=A0A4Z1EKS4_9HELO|nr:hypothetical protein BTUL_0079g00160 [Botrytis tulipae]
MFGGVRDLITRIQNTEIRIISILILGRDKSENKDAIQAGKRYILLRTPSYLTTHNYVIMGNWHKYDPTERQ